MGDYFDRHSKEWDKKQYRLERAQALARAIKEVVRLTNTTIMLDFGCGTGLLGFEFAGFVGQLWFGDTSDGMLSEVRKKAGLRRLENAHAWNVEKECVSTDFDLIVSSMVLHHIDNVPEQIRTLIGWLRPGGYICLCDLEKEDGSYHDGEIVPHNGFDRVYIVDILRKHGLCDITDRIVYGNKKTVNGEEKSFPVFMIAGRKADNRDNTDTEV